MKQDRSRTQEDVPTSQEGMLYVAMTSAIPWSALFAQLPPLPGEIVQSGGSIGYLPVFTTAEDALKAFPGAELMIFHSQPVPDPDGVTE